MQAAYEEFGCNDGNVFFLGIDKGNTNNDVMVFDSIYGIQYPGVSGQGGGGNEVHLTYNIQATPTVVVITPDKLIATHQIFPPNTSNIVDSVSNAGGILQACITDIPGIHKREEILAIGPNPVRNYAYLTLHLEGSRYLEVSVLNLTGQKVADFGPQFYESGTHLLKADLSGQSEGFYFVRIRENDQVFSTKKLILVN